jgi:hypothetical protein
MKKREGGDRSRRRKDLEGQERKMKEGEGTQTLYAHMNK